MRNELSSLVAAGSLGFLGLACLAVSSCSTLNRTVMAPPDVPGAHFVGNATCADCHTNYARVYAASPHGRFHREDLGWAGRTGCESCHGPGSEHVRVGGGRGRFIVNPGKDPSACFQCHLDVHAQFNLPSHHPVLEERMNCVQCHDPHGSDIFKPARSGLAMARVNEACANCHREQSRPFVFEHEALREGCITCHSPHGSVEDKLLVARDSNLCLRCHAQRQNPGSAEIVIGQVPHGAFLQMGTCYSAGCHTAVHGSNVNPKLRY